MPRFRGTRYPLLKRPTVAAAFSPTDIAGLEGWWKADGTLWQDSARTTPATSDADPVGAWDDGSGNARHLLQATSTKRGTLKTGVQNGRSVIRFDGTDDWVRSLAFSLNQPCTLYVAIKLITRSFTGRIWDGTGADKVTLSEFNTEPELTIFAGSAFAAANTDLATGAFGIIRAIYNGASSSLRVNAGTPTTGNPGSNNFDDGITLGNKWDGSQPANIDVGELLAYSGSHSSVEEQSVRDYLNGRFAAY